MHKKSYAQLGQTERERIYQLKKRGKKNGEIAAILGRDKSTIGRELRRNQHLKFKQYLPDTAERKAQTRKARGRKTRYVVRHPAYARARAHGNERGRMNCAVRSTKNPRTGRGVLIRVGDAEGEIPRFLFISTVDQFFMNADIYAKC